MELFDYIWWGIWGIAGLAYMVDLIRGAYKGWLQDQAQRARLNMPGDKEQN